MLLFGDQTWTTVWSYAGASNIGIDERDVTAYLNATPVAAFRSDNDYFDAACAILVIEYGGQVVPPTPTPTPTPDSTGGNDDAGKIAAAGDLSAGETTSFSYSGTVSRVLVTVSRQTSGIMLAVTETQDVPVDGPSGAVYCYLETDLSYTTDEGIEDAVFEFSVPLSWLAEQGLTVRDVVLMRYHNGVWTALPTEVIGESGNEVHYRATSPGFSYFAVVTEKNGASVADESVGEIPAATVTPAAGQTPGATTPVTPTATATSGTTAVPATTPQASPILGVLPFAALGIFLLMKRK
jgi:PGF-pre-PGF domain-containing protein